MNNILTCNICGKEFRGSNSYYKTDKYGSKTGREGVSSEKLIAKHHGEIT